MFIKNSTQFLSNLSNLFHFIKRKQIPCRGLKDSTSWGSGRLSQGYACAIELSPCIECQILCHFFRGHWGRKGGVISPNQVLKFLMIHGLFFLRITLSCIHIWNFMAFPWMNMFENSREFFNEFCRVLLNIQKIFLILLLNWFHRKVAYPCVTCCPI